MAMAPGHGVLLYNLMKTARALLPDTRVINVSIPDYLHEILGKVGLTPDVVVGNVNFLEPILKYIIAEKCQVSPESFIYYSCRKSLYVYANFSRKRSFSLYSILSQS